jgi:hypothetical protein
MVGLLAVLLVVSPPHFQARGAAAPLHSQAVDHDAARRQVSERPG